MEKGNIKIGISHGSMFFKLLIAQIIIDLGIKIVFILIEYLLFLCKLENIVNNSTPYLYICSTILSTIIAIKFVSRKYILNESTNIFVNKIIILLIVSNILLTSMSVYNSYKKILVQIKTCDAVKVLYEDALEEGREIPPYKETCKTLQESIDEVQKDKEWHIWDRMVFPVIELNIIFISEFIILIFYTKKKLEMENK